jgi:general secretion pathway protein A
MPRAQERAGVSSALPALKASAAATAATTAAASTVPASPAASAAPADALQWLRAQGPVADGAAWAALASDWQWTLAPGSFQGDPCDAAPSRSLRCFSSDGGLALIRQLDRPALITVHDGDRALKVVLSGVGDRTATLRLGPSSQAVTLSSLAGLWHGDFVTLWRPPPGYRGKITAGQGGAAVDWLAAHLAQWQGEAVPAPGARMDQALRERLSAFQVAQGLKSDAVAGPVSLMVLNRATGVAEPALRTAQP